MLTTTAQPTNRAFEILVENVGRLTNSDDWKATLDLKAKLTSYSFNNLLLIAIQRPDASMVAGYRKWQDMGRQVRKGEKSIAILAPIVKKVTDKDTGEEARKVVGFRAASVFDVSQTDGDELPQLPRPQMLDGDDASIQEATQAVTAFAISLGSTVEMVDANKLGGANGSFTPSTKAIHVRADVAPLQALKTLVHEVAHAMLHADKADRTSATLTELEAESTAYLVCNRLGLDTGRYSFAYLAHWSGEADEILKAGTRACKAADQLLAAVAPQGVTA